MKIYWCSIVDTYSDYYGEEFFVEANSKKEVSEIVALHFPGEAIVCYGPISEEEAERNERLRYL